MRSGFVNCNSTQRSEDAIVGHNITTDSCEDVFHCSYTLTKESYCTSKFSVGREAGANANG